LHAKTITATVLVGVTLVTGCSSGKTTGSAGTSATSRPGTRGSITETAPVAPLNSSQCAQVNDASVDLVVASDRDGARRAANALEGHNPPTPVKNAIEHFVSSGGAHFDDPDYPKNYKVLDDWVQQVCPAQ